jgi:FixJ family two-component response regulator
MFLKEQGAWVHREIISQERRGPTADPWVAIVDDHDSLRASLARAFRLEGVRVESFASAEAFLARTSSSAPVCLVLDMQLPEMSGHDLWHHLKRDPAPVPPTVFISGHDDLLAALDGCCAPYGRLRKPFDVNVLLDLVIPLTRPD